MGWVNYIIVPKLKLVVETSRSITSETTYISNVLKKEDNALYGIEEKPCSEITVLDLQSMVNAVEDLSGLRDTDYDEFLLLWLDQRGIEYKVVSEYQFNEGKKYQELTKDFVKIDTWDDDETDKGNYVLGEED